MSAQQQLFEVTAAHKARHGAVWTAGNWECRNFHGYFQSREGGTGPWCFQIYGFGDEDCSVYALAGKGEMVFLRVPIDQENRITVRGCKYGRDNWNH
jgi:hypothetical protein